MAAVSVSNPYGALVLSVQVANASETETQLAAAAVIVGFMDEFNRARIYNPWAMGYTPVTSDTPGKWLPTVVSVTPVTAPDGSGQVGTVKVVLQPGSSDLVNVASVQTLVVDSRALFIVATGAF